MLDPGLAEEAGEGGVEARLRGLLEDDCEVGVVGAEAPGFAGAGRRGRRPPSATPVEDPEGASEGSPVAREESPEPRTALLAAGPLQLLDLAVLLALPGLVAGLLGYAAGTYLGLAVAYAVRGLGA